MKTLFTALLISIGIYSGAIAQTHGTTEFGVNVGYNAAIVTTNAYTNTTYRSGFNVAVGSDYFFSDRWSIKAKLIYDQKGWGSGVISTANGDLETTYQVNYITFPVMANWHFGHKRNWYLHFGPYVGFLLNARETTLRTDVKSALNNIDFGLASGIGIKFNIGEISKLFIEFDGQDGVLDIFKHNDYSTVRNARTSINVGISLPLK